VEDLHQLHQFPLWCKEQNVENWLPQGLQLRCRQVFVSAEAEPSRLQNDVMESLQTLQGINHVEEEVQTKIGYSLDAAVVFQGNPIGVEADGPFHFVGQLQSPNGATLLKRRQLRAMEGWKLVAIQYWEWNDIDKGNES
jgi:RAP domain/FAST kinase-like protein, subdomain 2